MAQRSLYQVLWSCGMVQMTIVFTWGYLQQEFYRALCWPLEDTRTLGRYPPVSRAKTREVLIFLSAGISHFRIRLQPQSYDPLAGLESGLRVLSVSTSSVLVSLSVRQTGRLLSGSLVMSLVRLSSSVICLRVPCLPFCVRHPSWTQFRAR